jgi:DNA-binding transcriptional LysR family regulator
VNAVSRAGGSVIGRVRSAPCRGAAGGAVGAWRLRTPTGRGHFDFLPPTRVLTSDPVALVDRALAHHGICQTGRWHVPPHLDSGRLRRMMAALLDPGEREIVVHGPHRQFPSARVRTVVDALRAHLAAAAALHLRPADVAASWHARPPDNETRLPFLHALSSRPPGRARPVPPTFRRVRP